ncbi:MAG: 50S ribosomal protein L24 [bacterium]|nr:50S ribosomal protein L24 [bacterium]MDZ4299458.1 50S ribosomal protein L24 [Candidatus Sungbacteria bacterium]
MKLKKGDTIRVIAGNDKGKTGTILTVFPEQERILVDGINVKKKHVRPRAQGQKGEIVQLPRPFRVSRAMLVCPKCGVSVRVSRELREGRTVRVCKKCGATLS